MAQKEIADMGNRYVGIDVGAAAHYACAIDLDARSVVFSDRPLPTPEVVDWVKRMQANATAVDSPPQPNMGLLPPDCGNRRVAEYQLYIGGCYATPAYEPPLDGPQAWMGAGMALFRQLAAALNVPIDLGNGAGRLVETHPTYAFKALLGDRRVGNHQLPRVRVDPARRLRPKREAQGHEDRVELLTAALEELSVPVTQMLRGRWNSRIDWVDCTMCALIAAWRHHVADQVRAVGHPEEGAIFLRFPRSLYALAAAPTRSEAANGEPVIHPDEGDHRPAAIGDDGWEGPVTLVVADNSNIQRRVGGVLANQWLTDTMFGGGRLRIRLVNEEGEPEVRFVPHAESLTQKTLMASRIDNPNRALWVELVHGCSARNQVVVDVLYRWDA